MLEKNYSNNNTYKPPFTITSTQINYIAEIAALTERFAIRMEMEDSLRLRKANKIKTIHSSLAIEGNTLTEDEVKDIFEGKPVVAPIKQIQEVKNAIKTYEIFETLDPFNQKDLLYAHSIMMQSLTDDAGHYRKSGVGVFSKEGFVHIAPPAERVNELMHNLFDWLKNSNDHLLIKSCVFHYEFEFIHPFSDGNGRTGRLWQSLILAKLNPIFENLPVENMVYSNQEEYYNAIQQSTDKVDCAPFIEFMLLEILKTLQKHKGEPLNNNSVTTNVTTNVTVNGTVNEKNIVSLIFANSKITIKEISEALELSERTVKRYISSLQKKNILKHIGANKNGEWQIINK